MWRLFWKLKRLGYDRLGYKFDSIVIGLQSCLKSQYAKSQESNLLCLNRGNNSWRLSYWLFKKDQRGMLRICKQTGFEFKSHLRYPYMLINKEFKFISQFFQFFWNRGSISWRLSYWLFKKEQRQMQSLCKKTGFEFKPHLRQLYMIINKEFEFISQFLQFFWNRGIISWRLAYWLFKNDQKQLCHLCEAPPAMLVFIFSVKISSYCDYLSKIFANACGDCSGN